MKIDKYYFLEGYNANTGVTLFYIWIIWEDKVEQFTYSDDTPERVGSYCASHDVTDIHYSDQPLRKRILNNEEIILTEASTESKAAFNKGFREVRQSILSASDKS